MLNKSNHIEPSQTGFLKIALIIIGNLIPLIGVIFWSWNLANIILLYWLENIVLGFWTIAKILTSQGKGQGSNLGAKLFICCFFTVHYGIFCLVHLGFILGMIVVSDFHSFLPLPEMINTGLITRGVLIGTAIMLITHGIDFFQNYLSSEQRKQDPPAIMFSPYGHIVVIHVAIILSAAVVMFTGEAIGLLILIILGKIALELFPFRPGSQKQKRSH